ncbi:MAG: PIG-L family deacetylase, partial [Mycobacteriales bacterium]
MLFVHAHPDDETIFTGATAAQYAALGVHVTLVCCTLGEQGEIYVPELAQLSADEADQLGGYRLAELRAACRELGIAELISLGGAG